MMAWNKASTGHGQAHSLFSLGFLLLAQILLVYWQQWVLGKQTLSIRVPGTRYWVPEMKYPGQGTGGTG